MDAVATPDISLFADFRLDRRGGALYRRDEQGVFTLLAIGRRALDILGLLIERPGDLVSRGEIIEAVWHGRAVEDSNLNVQIAALRRILDRDREQGSCIQTVSGRGYRFVTPVARCQDDAHTASHAIALPDRRAPRLSIVVLPFANLSDDRQQEYFADAVTDSLTTDLSRIQGSSVISCTTAFTYKGRGVGVRQTGAELGVLYVLEGSVQRAGTQVRINTQLIDAETEAHLWAERFEHEIVDLFALQTEIVARIANALSVELVTAETARPTVDLDAVDYFLRGRAAFNKGPTRDNYVESIGLFERALILDPTSVSVQVSLANALISRVLEGMADSPAADVERIERLITHALTVSPRSAKAHFVKGQLLRHQHRPVEASAEYETVLALDPNSTSALINVGRCRIRFGSLDEAILPMERSIQLSPRDPFIGSRYEAIARVHLLQSRIDEAIRWLERARSASPLLPVVHLSLASAYGLKSETERAAAELAEARSLAGEGSYPSIARMRPGADYVPKIQALFEATYLAGLRQAGMPEE